MLALINLLDNVERGAVQVLAPEVQRTLGLSDLQLGAVIAFDALLLIPATLATGWIADRLSRTRLAGILGIVDGACVVLTGLARSYWQFAAARTGTGTGQMSLHSVHNSLLADRYALRGRSRIFAVHHLALPVGALVGPLVGGGIATLVGGPAGWRAALAVIGTAMVGAGALALMLRDPARGRGEQLAVIGEVLDTAHSPSIPFGMGVERLRRIRSLHFFLLGMAALGFSLVGQITFFYVFLDRQFHLDALQRGLLGTVIGLGSIAGVPLGGVLGDRAFRSGPPRAILLAASAIATSGVVFVAGLYMPALLPFAALMVVSDFLGGLGFVPLSTFVAAVTPYRLRSLGFSLVGIYLFVFGGIVGGMLTGIISGSLGPRAALSIVGLPSALVGGALMAWGARHARHDLSLVVEEIREEREERRRRDRGGEMPVLHIAHLDVSHGHVQVLDDVGLEVRRGEVLALLGTNGAGKTTLLRAVSGLAVPDRGVVRLHGRTITYLDAEQRAEMGIVHIARERVVFPTLSVRENLLVGARVHRRDGRRAQERVDSALSLFPVLAERAGQRAGALSGGEQQMLALARAVLVDPELLLVDELTLGLAPAVVTEVLAVVARMRSRGIAMVVVEQSLNIALAVADRAVFLERGRVRFDGTGERLLERGDLVRPIFLDGGTPPA